MQEAGLEIDQLRITIKQNIEADTAPKPLDFKKVLNTYLSSLPLLIGRGEIQNLNLCLPSIPCFSSRLNWWLQENSLQIRSELLAESTSHDLILALSAQRLQMHYYQSGKNLTYADIQVSWPMGKPVQMDGKFQAMNDSLLSLFVPEMPAELTKHLEYVSASFKADLNPRPLANMTDLVAALTGSFKLETSGSLQWTTKNNVIQRVKMPLLLELNKPTEKNISVTIPSEQQIEVVIPKLPVLLVTNNDSTHCDYNLKSKAINCRGGGLLVSSEFTSTLVDPGKIIATAYLNSFSLNSGQEKPLSFNTNIELTAQNLQENLLTASGTASLTGDIIQVDLEQLSALNLTSSRFLFSHSIDTEGGDLQAQYTGNTLALKQWFDSPINGDFEIQQEASWQGPFNSDIHSWPVQVTSSINADNLSGNINGYLFHGGKLDGTLTGWASLESKESIHLQWSMIDAGFPLHQTSLEFNLSLKPFSGHFDIQGIAAETHVLGGRIHSESYEYYSDSKQGQLLLSLDKLDLLEVIALEQQDFYAEGKLTGNIPVKIAGGQIFIEDGFVMAIEPGGIIQYHPSDSVTDLAASSSQMITVLDTLENFRYDGLKSKVEFGSDGILHLRTSLTGSNPDFENGRRINFNLNIEEDIAALLESLKLTDDITRQVDKNYSKQIIQ
jgi:hypothetical protein